jgi:peptidoglycan/LPS O-acetylase OafA/YrhL
MLIPAYFSVFLFRNEIFDLRYLLFLQNYILQIPFFKVSWSICVEEHFYLILPFVLALIYKIKSNAIIVLVILILLFSPLVFRIIEFKQVNFFGYYETASHFHFDSMILGVIASWFYTFKKLNFSKSIKILFVLFPILVFISAIFITREVMFIYGKFFLSLTFSLLILVFAGSKQLIISTSVINSSLAKSSYATYLSHALIINFYLSLVNIQSNKSIFFMSFNILAMLVLSLFVGHIFYFVIETRIMRIREKIIPKKRPLLNI